MGDVDGNIFSICGPERSLDMNIGRNRQRCPPAVVITHDSDVFSSSSINPADGEGLLGCKKSGGLGSSTLSLATEGRNGMYAVGPPSRAGSPRHSKIHPTNGSSLPKSCSSVAIFSTEGQPIGNETQSEYSEHHTQRKTQSNCCNGRAKRSVCGFLLTITMCATWIGITHLLKWAYIIHLPPASIFLANFSMNESNAINSTEDESTEALPQPFKAPFFMTWFCTACNSLFFPAYIFTMICSRKKRTVRKSLFDAMRRFHEKGLSALHFFTRSVFFCVLWVATTYMFIHAISRLDATAMMALHASSASFIYLLSWVILHEQFVGIRIVAVILCNTGIALLAYMDGVSKTETLGGVVLAAAAAAGLSVHKVLFKKLIGGVTMGQLSLFLSLVGLLSVLMLWPIALTLYVIEAEVLVWTQLPYAQLGGAAALFILANVLGNFDIIHSYDTFLRLGVVSAVPVSAVIDVRLYNVVFEGMKLAGILLISIGFMLVLLPDNWPDYITRLIRWRWRRCPKSSKSADAAQPRPCLRTSSGNIK